MLVGTTQSSPQQVQQAVQQMGEEYKGNAYHLLQRNCNHFSNDLCVKLTGQAAPLWVSVSVLLLLHRVWIPSHYSIDALQPLQCLVQVSYMNAG